jgi:hypothetical protein
MGLVRWESQSALRAVVGSVTLALFGYVFAVNEPDNYLHSPALLGIIGALWVLILAVVPVLRVKQGTPHRALISIASLATLIATFVLVASITR